MIYFVQPAAPKYRIPFYDRVNKHHSMRVLASRKDFLGVSTVENKDYVELVGEFLGNRSLAWQRGLNFFRFERKDVVVISGNPRVINHMLLMLFCKLRGIKTVWWGQGWSAGSRGLASRVRLHLMQYADKVLVYTDVEKEELLQVTQLIPSNVFALNNGLDSELIAKASAATSDKTESYEDKKDLIFIGRLTEKSNIKLLIEALSLTKNKVSINVIGAGDSSRECEQLAEVLGVSDRVVWHGQVFEEVKIAKIMSDSKFFVYAGAVGLSLIHAFNYGLPALVHDVRQDHMPEIAAFKEGSNGLCFKKGCARSLAEKMDLVFNMPKSKYENHARFAKSTVERSFNTNDMFVRFDNLLQSLGDK